MHIRFRLIMMKLYSTLFFLPLLPVLLCGQFHFDLHPVSEDVVEIKETHYNGIFRKSGWNSVYTYADGKIQRTRNWYKGDLRMDETYTYEWNSDEIIKRTSNLDNTQYHEVDSVSTHLLQRKIFFSRDSINPSLVLHSFVYDSKDNLLSYKRTSERYDGTKSTSCVRYKYSKDKIVIQYMGDSITLNKTVTCELDSRGNIILKTTDYHDPNVVISGGRSEKGVIRFKYKYDRRGNWTKRYYVSSKGKCTLEIKRKITYKK